MKTLSIIAALALTACIDTPEPQSGKQAFMENCASCHGIDAKGGGEMADVLIKMPPDLTTLSARHNGTFPSDYVMSTIDGLQRAPHFSGAMPEFGANGMGDTVLQGFARTLSLHLRQSDLVGRYGGEEFGVILLDTAPERAFVVMDKIRLAFAKIVFEAVPVCDKHRPMY